jgi:hypothetical protein
LVRINYDESWPKYLRLLLLQLSAVLPAALMQYGLRTPSTLLALPLQQADDLTRQPLNDLCILGKALIS